MADDALTRRGRALEEEYFWKKDQQLIEKLRQAAAAERDKRDMGAKIGIDDPETLQELQALGFTPDTVILLPLVPVVQMAWADGSVAAKERALILELARSRAFADGKRRHPTAVGVADRRTGSTGARERDATDPRDARRAAVRSSRSHSR